MQLNQMRSKCSLIESDRNATKSNQIKIQINQIRSKYNLNKLDQNAN